MRYAVLGLLAVGFVALAQGADEPKDEDVPAVTESQAIAIGRVIEELNLKTRIDVVNYPLDGVCKDIAKHHKLKIVFDGPALTKAGIAADARITVAARDVTLRDCMFKMLHPHGLTYKIRPDGLLITPLPAKAP